MAKRVPLDLVRIAAAGGGIAFDVGERTMDELLRIAAGAAKGRAQVIMRGLASRSTDELERIGAAGKGHVLFIID
jgi:hypothetical protein